MNGGLGVACALLCGALSACGRAPRPAVRQVDLGGAWQMRAASDSAWIPATVPGTVHTDLLAARRIPDPLTGDHEAALAWIEDEDWVYRRDFDVDPTLLDAGRVTLVFEGLDTYADVTVNGAPVLEADDQFRTWRADVADALHPGRNTLEVRFASAVRVGAERAAAHPWPIPHQEPDARGTRAFTRKAAYSYGWDWGPRYVTSGIVQGVRLEAWSGVRIRDVWPGPPEWHGDTARVPVTVELETAVPTTRVSSTVRVGLSSPDGSFEARLLDVPAPLSSMVSQVQATLTIPHAERWWPLGMGHPAGRLYDVSIDVVADGDATVAGDSGEVAGATRRGDSGLRDSRRGRFWDRVTRRIGVRTGRLVTEPDSDGARFRFEVNGEPVFARGANLVPPDHFVPRADSAAWARLLDDATGANMNMLRVWGGGVYPPDVFYDLADARGVLVWQDFMFANALVPADSTFEATVAAEARDQVRRLRRHASLALWCGNNEIAEGWANWGWRDAYSPAVAARVDAAYRRIFEGTLPDVVAAEDPDVDYWPSSPRIGWGHPESLTEGDSHYWGVWWGMEPFRAYAEKVPLFASEFGFQALPDPVTLAAFGDPAPTSLSDPLLRAHEKHPTGLETIRAYLARDWPVPPDDSLDAWSYVSQLAQAEGVGLALEAHRRAWPRTGGTLFWQLNDTWPVVSWSSVDVFGRWKALQYEARRVFAPVAVLADRWTDTLAVWVVADTALSGTLELRVLDFDGVEVARRDTVASAGRDSGAASVGRDTPVASAGLVWRGPRGALLPPRTDPRAVLVVATLRDADGTSLATDRAFFAEPGALALPDPGLRVTSADSDEGGWDVALTADRFAYAVRLSVDGVGARFSANYVDLLPGDTLRVRVVPDVPTADLPARLRLRSLADVPRG